MNWIGCSNWKWTLHVPNRNADEWPKNKIEISHAKSFFHSFPTTEERVNLDKNVAQAIIWHSSHIWNFVSFLKKGVVTILVARTSPCLKNLFVYASNHGIPISNFTSKFSFFYLTLKFNENHKNVNVKLSRDVS